VEKVLTEDSQRETGAQHFRTTLKSNFSVYVEFMLYMQVFRKGKKVVKPIVIGGLESECSLHRRGKGNTLSS